MESLKIKKQRLTWIIDFINEDIDNLSSGEFLGVLVEAPENIKNCPYSFWGNKESLDVNLLEIYHFQSSKVDYSDILTEDTPTTREIVKSIHKKIKNFFEKIYETQKRTAGELEEILNFKGLFYVHIKDGGIILGELKGKYSLEFEIAELIYDCSPQLGGRFNFYRSLEYIKKCQAPGCNKFLVEFHKKEKNYCSNKCAWRAYSKFKRDDEKKSGTEQRKKRKEG